jgi:succinate dehydrogenase/fumarate reductase flavoprotein subunit
MSSVPGLFGAGDLVFGGQDHSHAAATGRYAGARAALYAREQGWGEVDAGQVFREKSRVYAPLSARGPRTVDWKELNAGIARVMQNYCSEPKNEELLDLAQTWLADLERNEAPLAAADNPHKLMRTLDVLDILTCAQIIVQACKARRASSDYLHFKRLDHPDIDPAEWHKWITVRLGERDTEIGELPIAFWGELERNYRPRHDANLAAMGAAVGEGQRRSSGIG